jgi:hypothetical protein
MGGRIGGEGAGAERKGHACACTHTHTHTHTSHYLCPTCMRMMGAAAAWSLLSIAADIMYLWRAAEGTKRAMREPCGEGEDDRELTRGSLAGPLPMN